MQRGDTLQSIASEFGAARKPLSVLLTCQSGGVSAPHGHVRSLALWCWRGAACVLQQRGCVCCSSALRASWPRLLTRAVCVSGAGTSIEGIRNLNYDLRSESAVRELPSGSSICIFPDTCTE